MAVGNVVPSSEFAWNWLISIVPTQFQPLVGVIAVLAVLIWLAMKFTSGTLDFFDRIKKVVRDRRAEPVEIGVLPPPRVSIWNQPVAKHAQPKLVSEGGIPILTIATMKGGVGKTTLTANLAAYLDAAGFRILIVDFDYQGSLSYTMLAQANVALTASVADDLIRGEKTMPEILKSARSLSPLPKSKILTCYYEFSDTETHELVDWISESKKGGERHDVRFRLAGLLAHECIKQEFDLVLIDSPPRFTTGAINALCASTHLLIPTVLDRMSAEAAVYFSRDIASMRQTLFPNLELVGVVPTLTYQLETFTRRESDIIDNLNTSLQLYWGRPRSVLNDASVPRKNAIGDVAGYGISYVDAGSTKKTAEVREIFERVGEIVRERIGL